jgi:GNAT superfamily N-acetyltransferase
MTSLERPRAPETGEPGAPVYREPGRSYLSTLAAAVVIAIGFLVDLALGGGEQHGIGWAVAFVVVVGVDALVVHAARAVRTLVVEGGRLRLGDAVLDCADIAGAEYGTGEDPADLPVLGRRAGEGLPRGTAPLTLRLRDGSRLVVPTRFPERLAAVLGSAWDVPEVRTADADELALLPSIDERAETLFRVAGIELPVLPFAADGLADAEAVFVHGRPPVGFVQLDEVDGLAHVAELAVLPGHMRHGVGSALLEAACEWARERGYPAVSLTTFEQVPWNGPFYAARGFVQIEQLGPEMREIRDWEIATGLDAAGRRVVMRREL